MTEFSRLYRIAALSVEPLPVEIDADQGEREALARRFGLVGIGRLAAEAELARRGDVVAASGILRAEVTQSCVATAEPVDARIEEPFDVEFRPVPAGGRPDDEIELGEGELDVVFYEGAAVDLGEAVAQTLLLALDPYPRSAAADSALRDAGVRSEEEAREDSSPFAALKGLKGD
jgi:uncharacterized metal-binding protein YceD (DUF177 family)